MGFRSAIFATRFLYNTVDIAESANKRWEISADLIDGVVEDCSEVSESCVTNLRYLSKIVIQLRSRLKCSLKHYIQPV